MTSRLVPTSLAAALALCGQIAPAAPAGALAVAQLAGIPTSPAFRMEVNKGESGAPEATAIGARPIDGRLHDSAGAKALPPGATPAKGRAGKGEAAASAADAASAPVDPLEKLRLRLAEKLGAKPSNGGKYVMRVSNHGESGESVVGVVRPGAAALAGAKHSSGASTAAPADPHAATSLLPTHWDYAGAGGPEAWGKLQPEFSRCATGTRQSPIDIRGGIAVDLEPIQFDYRPSGFSVIDNGHTVQVNVEAGNAITITGRRYELVQFHFHRPSEERIDGRQFDMVAHLVHKDADGRLAVVAVLLDRGSAQAIVQTVWNNLPLEKGEEVHAGARIDLTQLLPTDRRYYTYMGSLTTPPCSEGVLWMVMKQPVPISPEQVAIFARLYPMNARPIQQASGRLIKESN